MAECLRVLRVCSVFEPSTWSAGLDARFDPVGGMQTHTGELTRVLDRLGVRQVVLTGWAQGQARRQRFGARAVVRRLGVPVPVFRQCYAMPAAWLAPRLAGGADLVHAHLGEDLAVVPLAVAAATRAGIPLVLTVHTSLRHTYRLTGWRAAVLRLVGGGWEAYGCRRAAAVVCLTSRLAGFLADGGVPAERLFVIPSGFRVEGRGAPVPRWPGPLVLFVGRLHPQKGVDVLLRALALVPAARLVLAGDGPARRALERLTDRLGVRHRVRFLGFVPHREVPALLRRADVLALPSRYEELGTVLIEAMAAGLAVVASRVGGIPSLVEHGGSGLLVPPGDPPALAGALRAVLGDPGLAERLGRRGRELASGYSWEPLGARVLEVYHRVVAGRPRSVAASEVSA